MKRLIWWFRERESFKPAFTLVEMLIVVVIIGILWAAILPRFSWYLERTRDLKRQADLRNIAAAVERYKDEKWKYPLRRILGHEKGYSQPFGSVTELMEIVPDYLKERPKDPSSTTIIKLHSWPYWLFERWDRSNEKAREYWSVWWGENRNGGFILRPGDYLYQIFSKGENLAGAAVVVAKVETPDAANYVLDWQKKYNEWGLRGWSVRDPITKQYVGSSMQIDQLHLCNSVKKWDKLSWATATNQDCQYTSEDQLYYIVKIE